MKTAAVFVLIVLGTASALLMSRPLAIARWMWPGPTVKGPGDLYVQAFQALLCLIVLGVIALAASIASIVLARRMGWTAGQWLSVVPVASGLISLALVWLSRAR